jgi:hypothetical protein
VRVGLEGKNREGQISRREEREDRGETKRTQQRTTK